MPNPTQYDLFSRAFKADPHPTFAHLRQEAPIHAHVAPNGRSIWYITRHEDVVEILKDNERIGKNARNAFAPGDHNHPISSGGVLDLINQNMLFADPPDHTRLRSLVNKAFTPRRIDGMIPRIQQVTDELLDRVALRRQMEYINDFAFPMPMQLITDLLGVPEADGEQVREWCKAVIAPGSHGINWRQRKRYIHDFIGYINALCAQRQQSPRDDLLTALVEAEESGDRFSEAERASMVVLLLVTGHETVVNMLGMGVVTLLQHPAQLALLQARPELWETAVEELLRYDGPVETSTTRWARQDFVFKGHHIRRGDLVRVVITSANRDGCQYAQPDQFDIEREDSRHLSFGLGIHFCLGAYLARLEGKIALQTLFTRFPTLALADETIEWRSGVLFRGPKWLNLRW